MSNQTPDQLYHIQVARQVDKQFTPDVNVRVNIFDTWYIAYGEQIVLAYAKYKRLDPSAASEVSQETYVRTRKRIEAGLFCYREVPFTAYIKLVALNIMRETWRQENKYSSIDEEVFEYLCVTPDIYHEVELKDIATQAVDKLTGNDRKVIYEAFFNYRTPEEIAQMFGLSISNVYQIQHRAIKHLRKNMGLGAS